MATYRIRYLVTKPGKNGNQRFYWQPRAAERQAGWQARRLPDIESAAIAAAQELNRALDAWRSGSGQTPIMAAATIDVLIGLYKKSARYKRLAQKTRTGYDQCLDVISAWAGDAPVATITRRLVRQLYTKLYAKTPAKANAVLRVLRVLMQVAVDEEWIGQNPASKPGMMACKPRDQIWSAVEIDRLVAAADKAGRASLGTAVLLAAYLGQRQGDILKLTWSAVRDGTATLRQAKTRRWVEVPLHPALSNRLRPLGEVKASPVIVLAETTLAPYTGDYFRHEFARIRAAAKIDKTKQFRDLRRTAVVRLAEAGATEAEVAAVTGHQIETTRQILETYLPRTGAMATAAIDKLVQFEKKVGRPTVCELDKKIPVAEDTPQPVAISR